MTNQNDVLIPINGQIWGQLEVIGGASRWDLSSLEGNDGAAPALMRAKFGGTAPCVTSDGSRVCIATDFWTALRFRRQDARIGLSRQVPWSITVRGGVSHLHANLTGLRLRELVIEGGAEDVLLELDEASGQVPIRIHGGVHKLTVSRAHGTALCVRVRGGASELTLDEMSLGAVGGPLAWQSQPASGSDYYDLQILGGASQLLTACASARAEVAPIQHASGY